MSGAATGPAATHHLTDASEAVAHLSFLLLDGVQLIEGTVKESLRQVACRPSRSRLLPRNVEVCHTQKSLVRGSHTATAHRLKKHYKRPMPQKRYESLSLRTSPAVSQQATLFGKENHGVFSCGHHGGIGWIAGKPAIVTLPQVCNADWLHDLRPVRRPHGARTFEAVDRDGPMLKADLALLCLASWASWKLVNMSNSPINVKTIATVPTWPWKANVRVPDVDAPGCRLRLLHAPSFL